MSGLLDFMSGRFAADLVSALLHTLWQALVIAGLLYVFLKHTAARNTNLRYGAGVASLVMVVICGLVTWAVLDFDPAAAPAKTSGSQRASAYGGFDWWRLRGIGEGKLAGDGYVCVAGRRCRHAVQDRLDGIGRLKAQTQLPAAGGCPNIGDRGGT